MMRMVRKNELEYQYMKKQNLMIQFSSWFPILLISSLFPAMSSCLFFTHSRKTISQCKVKSILVKTLITIFVFSVIPVIICIFIKQDEYYLVDVNHEWKNGINITTFPTSTYSLKSDRQSMIKTMNESLKWLFNFSMEAIGFGDCRRREKYKVPHNILFQLATNIVNLKIIIAYPYYFILCLAPFPILFHIYYCSSRF